MKTMNIFIFPLLTILFMAISHMGHAQNFDISPAPTPTSDAQILDQGIAYSLMLVALVITYMFH
ncbi:putative arabinogalactan peptide, AGP [Medicago truncatula]|uniref:Putative arabinogalactan peptide, AGP n=1 Tax=Medicago truncatula TaxID=3880 RepID=A0A396HPT2_MEDTR|nr:putative arabinogalactan peptide, AGP [Medicago truncatula]